MDDKKVVVYIEKVHKGNGYLLLDFPCDTHRESKTGKTSYYENFLHRLGIDGNIKIDRNKSASAIEIKNICFGKSKTPREGCYYEMPETLLQGRIFKANRGREPYIAYKGNAASEVGLTNFGRALNYGRYIHHTNENNSISDSIGFVKKLFSIPDFFDKMRKINASLGLKLVVRNVGQGNMNELHFAPESFILFDIGAKNATQLASTIGRIKRQYYRVRRLNTLTGKTPSKTFRAFVLSHWDIGHYNGLLYLQDSDINEFDIFVLPEELPTKTSQRAFGKLPSNRVLGVSRREFAQKFFLLSPFRLHRLPGSYSRNKSGIAITSHYNNKDILLTGDIHYGQINQHPMSDCNGNELYVVIPHHGGYAGDPNHINQWNRLKEAVISVGDNQWGHPLNRVIKCLNQQSGLTRLHITQSENKDYKKTC